MKIRMLFHHPEDDPSFMPNAVLCMDEYLLETCGEDVWEDEVERMLASLGPGSSRVAYIDVPERAVLNLFNPPVIRSEQFTPVGAPDE